MRESPTCATAMRVPSMTQQLAVQPMPGFPSPVSAPLMTASLAASTAAPSSPSSALAGAWLEMARTAMALATSPAACPPMPSQTPNSGLLTRKESSL